MDHHDPRFLRELVQVQWRDLAPIYLFVIRPTSIAKPPVVLYLYSYTLDLDRYRNDAFCEFLVKNGVAAVGFVSALSSQRYSGRPMKQWFVSEMRESLATSAHDVQMILNYLATRGDLDMDHVGMFGDGSGATIAILAAAVDPRIKALDLLDPWGDWPDWVAQSTVIPEKERTDYLKPEWLAAVAPLDPLKWLPELDTPRIRVQEIQTVTVTPEAAKKKIDAAMPPQTQFARYEDQQTFRSAIADGTGFDWIKAQLGAGTEVQVGTADATQPNSHSAEKVASPK